MAPDLSSEMWTQPIRWPEDRGLDLSQVCFEPLVFIARAVDRLAPWAPSETVAPRAWAAERIIEARNDGNLKAVLVYSDGNRLELDGVSWSSPDVVADFFRDCGVLYERGERSWLFVNLVGLNSLIRKAEQLGPKAGPRRQVRGEEARAADALRAQITAGGANVRHVPKRGDWTATCGLPRRAADRVWTQVAKEFPELSSRSKPRKKIAH